jgi:hypothetical protein
VATLRLNGLLFVLINKVQFMSKYQIVSYNYSKSINYVVMSLSIILSNNKKIFAGTLPNEVKHDNTPVMAFAKYYIFCTEACYEVYLQEYNKN